MGCGESKHAVATANTISQSKRSNSTKSTGIETAVDKATNESVQSQENGISSGETKDSNVVKETENAEKGPEDGIVNESVKAKEDKEEKVKENDHANGASEVENAKEIEENVQTVVVEKKELKEENRKESNFQVKQDVAPVQDEESHHFFSPRRDEETIESIISEGLSGKSEYHSPRARKTEPEDLTKENDVADEKGSPEETKMEAKNEEAVNLNEVKEAEAVSPAEGKDSASTNEEKASTAKEENVAEASTKDSKTN